MQPVKARSEEDPTSKGKIKRRFSEGKIRKKWSSEGKIRRRRSN